MPQRSVSVFHNRLILSIVDLVRRWWQADRIRISPAVGRLLRLHLGETILLRHQLWIVAGRSIRSTVSSTVLCYELVNVETSELAQLLVSAHPGSSHQAGPAELRLHEGSVSVWDEDVAVLATQKS